MNRSAPAPSPALTPTKLAMIVGLAIVLMVVLVSQFTGRDSTDVVLKKRTNRDPSTDDAEASNPAGSSHPAEVRVHWPEIHREEVAEFNPFEVPDALKLKTELSAAAAQSAHPIQVAQSSQSTLAQSTTKPESEQARMRAKERERRLNRIRAIAGELQKQGVGLVVSTSTGAVARIGEQEVRVGDVINGVLRIVEIGPQGIVVEEEPADE